IEPRADGDMNLYYTREVRKIMTTSHGNGFRPPGGSGQTVTTRWPSASNPRTYRWRHHMNGYDCIVLRGALFCDSMHHSSMRIRDSDQVFHSTFWPHLPGYR